MATTILGLGNPLLDISVEVSDLALCEKYKLKMGDAILAGPEHQALYTELVTAPFTPSYIAGGATQNSIRVAQWVSGSAPGFAAFIGSIGEDDFGTQLRTAASADGVKTLYQVQPKGTKPTGTCAVIIHNTERSLCANLVAAESLAASHLDTPEVAAALDSAKIIYTAGFPLTHDGGAESCLRLAKLAAEKGKTYAVNLSAPFLTQVPFFKGRLDDVVSYAGYVFCNETEAVAWGQTHDLGETPSVEAVAAAISNLPYHGAGKRVAVITQGASPTIIAMGGVVTHRVEVPAVAKIVDVNGAGDAFVGGFLAALAHGKDVEHAAKVGTWAAGIVIQRSGCTFDATLKCPLL